jgi:nucleoside-diphosphate kinase
MKMHMLAALFATLFSTLSAEPVSSQSSSLHPMISQPAKKEVEHTLSIIKPDGVASNHIGDIISRFEKAGLKIIAIKMVVLSKDQARHFYQVHSKRPFYPELVNFMSSGPVVVMVLEGENAIAKNRQLMGATNPQEADQGTIRSDYAESVSHNAVHGSDSPETAKEEIFFFFNPNEVFNRQE